MTEQMSELQWEHLYHWAVTVESIDGHRLYTDGTCTTPSLALDVDHMERGALDHLHRLHPEAFPVVVADFSWEYRGKVPKVVTVPVPATEQTGE